jgi:tetratricopeptide (TPR) repeat protein
VTLTQCPECSTQISIADENCPSCNFPVSKLRGLCAATLTQDSEMVAALIQMGADVNSVDHNGRTPLMIASLLGDDEIVEMLLAAGANPEFVNDAGESALSLAQTKGVERLLRRAIVVIKFSAARKKETETEEAAAIPQEPKIEEPVVEEVPVDVEEALTHLEPVIEPPRMNLDSTRPMPSSFKEISSDVPIIPNIDSTQPIPTVFPEIEVSADEDEPPVELEADPEESPLAAEIDQFIQTELQDVQPPALFEAGNEYSSLTLDPMEESLTEFPEVQPLGDEIDEYIQTELHAGEVQQSVYHESINEEPSLTLDPMEELLMASPENSEEAEKQDEFLQTELHTTENVYHSARIDSLLESQDPTEQWLEEAGREIPIEPQQQPAVIPEPVVEQPAPVLSESPPVQREMQRWEDWKHVEQAVAFAPWKIEDDSLTVEPIEEFELAQPIDEIIPPKTPEVPPQILMNSTRTRNVAIGIGIAIFLIPLLLFMNWQSNSKSPTMQAKAIKAPEKESKPVISAPKPAPAPVKSEPKVEVQKKSEEPAAAAEPAPAPVPKKSKPKIAAAVNPERSKKPTKVKYESKKNQPEPVTQRASAIPPVNEERLSKARELNDQGSDLLRAGKVSEGISRLEQAVHIFPKGANDENYASALLNLGRAWRMAGRPDISIRILEKRMKINIERDAVERELVAAKRQAVESGMGINNN